MSVSPYIAMGSRPTVKTENFDMDSFFDFSQGTTQPSPVTASSSRSPKNVSQDWNALSPYDNAEERQFNGPSHDYNQYKQQVGLPVGSMMNMPIQSQSMYDGYNSGIDMSFDGFGNGWNSGIDMDSDMNMDFNQPAAPAMFLPPANNDSQTQAFIDPNSIGGQEEQTSNVGRLWPGMHSQQAQQAAMQKAAQVNAVQQRQMKLQAQHAQYRQAANGSQSQSQASSSQQSHGSGKRASHASEPHVEESISRLLNQMRNNSAASADDEDSPDGNHPHVNRMRKDEEEMDEDERLLASDEGKKLSSKERRQLRNKVSARAFRSRRKEYIGQLEGEVAMKVNEAGTLRSENNALRQENERYRGLIETLLRHPAFTPFINDISKDPSVLGMPQMQPQQQQAPQPIPQPQQQVQQPIAQPAPQREDVKPEFLNFDASQLQVPQQQQHSESVGLAMIPENDFSKLNLNGFQAMNFNNFQRVNAFAVVELPKGPDPVDLLIESPAQLLFSAASTTTASDSSAAASDSDLTVLLAKLDSSARKLGGFGRAPV